MNTRHLFGSALLTASAVAAALIGASLHSPAPLTSRPAAAAPDSILPSPLPDPSAIALPSPSLWAYPGDTRPLSERPAPRPPMPLPPSASAAPLQDVTALNPVAEPTQGITPATPEPAPAPDARVASAGGGDTVGDPAFCKYGVASSSTYQWGGYGRTITDYTCAWPK